MFTAAALHCRFLHPVTDFGILIKRDVDVIAAIYVEAVYPFSRLRHKTNLFGSRQKRRFFPAFYCRNPAGTWVSADAGSAKNSAAPSLAEMILVSVCLPEK